MTEPVDLYPLFDRDLVLNADEARAIVGALQDISETDGVHEAEQALIQELVADFNLELGDESALEKVTPEQLAVRIRDPAVRKLAVQTGVLLAMADGAISDKERARVLEYARPLGFDDATYGAVEQQIVAWVRSGKAETLFV
ncbi:MAG: tellurite resistance TerB family protein [Polyangiaceae bacterium]|nr:tellurite resistance TerB family protein [Polyangiaceae bacterium]